MKKKKKKKNVKMQNVTIGIRGGKKKTEKKVKKKSVPGWA